MKVTGKLGKAGICADIVGEGSVGSVSDLSTVETGGTE